MEKAQISISINGLSCAVDGKVILDNINLDLTSGQSISVTGPNGVGKTLLLHTIIGFKQVSRGTY